MSTKQVCEIINPSDAYTMVVTDKRAATVAMFFLANGNYSLRAEGGEQVVPMFPFGGAEEWVKAEFDCSIDSLCNDTPFALVADHLDSVLIGGFSARRTFDAAMAAIDDPKKAKKFAEEWHDNKRSSMNDIGGRAKALAKALRAKKQKTKKLKAKAQA